MGEVVERSRLGRLFWLALLALATLACFAIPAHAAAKPQRIVAVGDLHGDYDAWVRIATAAGLMDTAGHWAGGPATLVQLGDILDRWPDSLKIVRSLQQLQVEAPASGGRVVVVLGNHEAMNLLGDFRYTTAGEFAAFADQRSPARREQYYIANRKGIEGAAHARDPALTPSQVRDFWMAQHPLGWVEHKTAWSRSGELGRWATRNPAIVMIDGTLFVHGGVSAEYAKLGVNAVNHSVASAMANAEDGDSSVLNDPLGPLWYRGLLMHDVDADAARDPRARLTPEEELGQSLAVTGAKRMVVGHTPDRRGIQFLYGGRLARIDTAISRAYNGTLSWLEIVGGTMTAHSVARSAP